MANRLGTMHTTSVFGNIFSKKKLNPMSRKTWKKKSINPASLKEQSWGQCLHAHFADYLKHYKEKHEKSHGYLRPIVEEVVNKYLECGDLSKGFARVVCKKCRREYLLAFSCRGRWFCPRGNVTCQSNSHAGVGKEIGQRFSRKT